jgi:hypothetical protein
MNGATKGADHRFRLRHSTFENGVKQFRSLTSGRAWLFEENGKRVRIAPALAFKSELSQGEANPYLPTLASGCAHCFETGQHHKKGCNRPSASAVSATPTVGSQSILSFLARPGASSSTPTRVKIIAVPTLDQAPAAAQLPQSHASQTGLTSANALADVLPQSTEVVDVPQTSIVAPPQDVVANAKTKENEEPTATVNVVNDEDAEDDTFSAFPALRDCASKGWHVVRDRLEPHQLEYPFPFLTTLEHEACFWALRFTSFFVWHPQRLLPSLCQGWKPTCPSCKSDLEGNGFDTSTFRLERGVGTKATILVPAALRCTNRSCTKSHFTTVHPEILQTMPDHLRGLFRFVVRKNGAFMSTETLSGILAKAVGFVSFNQQEQESMSKITTEFARLEFNRRSNFVHWRTSTVDGQMRKEVLPGNIVTDFSGAFALRSGIARRFFLEELTRQMPLLQSSFLSSILASQSLHIDMWHPFGQTGSATGETGFWVFLNGYAELVAGRSATSKSLEDAASVLDVIAAYCKKHGHKIKVVFTDNPEIDQSQLRKAFGEDVVVCKDVFHIIAALFDCAKKHAQGRLNWEHAVLSSFWQFVEEDVERERKRALSKVGSDAAAIQKMFSNPGFLLNHRGIRHILRDPEEIAKRVESHMNAWSLKGVFTAAATKVLEPTLETIRNFLRLPEDFQLHVNIGTVEEPIWRYRQGTSLVECFNRLLNAMHLERFSEDMATAMVAALAYSFSHKERLEYRGLNLMEHLRDPSLQNDLIVQQATLQEKKWIQESSILLRDISLIKVPDTTAEHLTGFNHPLGSLAERAIDFWVHGERSQIPKVLSSRHDPAASLDAMVSLRTVLPFQQNNKDELDLLNAMLRHPMFYKKRRKNSLFHTNGDLQTTVLFQSALKGELDKLIHFDTLCWEWNITVVVDTGIGVTWNGHKVENPSRLHGKEIVHFKNQLKTMAERASRNLLPSALREEITTPSLAAAPTAPPIFGPQTVALPDQESVLLGQIQPVTLPSVAPSLVNHDIPPPPPSEEPPSKKRSNPAGTSKKPAKSAKRAKVDESEESDDVVRCPECKAERHSTAMADCPFRRWSKEFPSVPRGGRESRSSAHRRLWPTVRSWFVTSGGGYFRDPSWNYLGPPKDSASS